MREQKIKDINKEFLEPAFKHLVENGLENTSVRDICKVLNVSAGSIYYWFDDKDEIYISTIKYGTGIYAGKLFDFTIKTMHTPEVFFNSFLDEVDKYIPEFRLIFQAASSPVYGESIREKALDFNAVYDEYIMRISESLGCSPEKLEPLVYMLISVLVDYVIWEDRKVSDLQMNFLYQHLTMLLEN